MTNEAPEAQSVETVDGHDTFNSDHDSF